MNTSLTRQDYGDVISDRTLAVLLVTWFVLLSAGLWIWLLPQQSELRHKQSELEQLEYQYDTLTQFTHGFNRDLENYPTRFALSSSQWKRFDSHSSVLEKELMVQYHPEEGPLHSVSVKPTSLPDALRIPSLNSDALKNPRFTLHASGSYTSLSRVVKWIATHQPFFHIEEISIQRHPELHSQFQLTAYYSLPTRSSQTKQPESVSLQSTEE